MSWTSDAAGFRFTRSAYRSRKMPMARPTKQDDQAEEVAVADRDAGEPGGDAGREQDGVGQRRREPPPLCFGGCSTVSVRTCWSTTVILFFTCH
jgi:hypothetical protein